MSKGNRITRELLRRRAEHNESIIHSLEELALHQEELVAIDAVLGMSCKKLKILYLQNNIIGKLENLQHLKDLEYLNVALNNIRKIQGLDACEFLAKLDLTVNFVDVDELEDSIAHLATRRHLKELYLMGNPAMNWPGCFNYVVASLPQLESLDGKPISRSARIIAAQQLPQLSLELRDLARAKRLEPRVTVEPSDDATPYTPEVRTHMYEEIAEQKREQEERRSHMQPKQRDAQKEQKDAVTRERTKQGHIKQCNQGKWDFKFDEQPDKLVLDVAIARHLDSSLIDLDVHPTYISVIIKAKTLRLTLPIEVKAEAAKAQRSKTTGHLLVIMPKLDDSKPLLFSSAKKTTTTSSAVVDTKPPAVAKTDAENPQIHARVTRKVAPPKLGNMLLDDAAPPPPPPPLRLQDAAS